MHFLDRTSEAPLPKQRRPGNKCVRPGSGAFGRGLQVHAAIHFDAKVQSQFLAPLVNLLNLGYSFLDERLSAETGVHRHHQQQVDLFKVRFYFFDGRGRVHREANLFSDGANLPEKR